MRKHRSWWMGFGIGLIVGAVMLQMMLFAEKQGEAPLPAEPLTAEQLSDEAKKANLLLLSQEQLDALVADRLAQLERESGGEAAGEEGAAGSTGTSGEPADSGSAANAAADEEPEPSETERQETEEAEQRQVSVNISYGMSLTEVGEELLKQGVIDDLKAFIEGTRPVANKMRVGTAVFTGKPTYQEIMDELVRPK
ncbi:hypothetical protein [Cohnella hongkongensis]|uniref:Endolytic transglycosylase MltG n=1 Tax=Cohnella hongkongensis TaxID=178337 RepID=A0ABV9FDW3_9BACL